MAEEGGGSNNVGGGGQTPISSFELIDPVQTAGHQFGEQVVILANGNIVVSAPNDSSVAAGSGAVHLFNPVTQTRVASLYGDTAGDALGYTSITALANGNFVIASQVDDENGTVNAGSVRLVNGITGMQIGSTIAGDTANDFLGNNGVIALTNNNFVIVSWQDDVGGIPNAGSVMLVNGSTGMQLGSTIAGDTTNDFLGNNGVIALANNNFVIASSLDNESGIFNSGSVRLVDGTTGIQIGNAITGDITNDQLGSITALANNNFVITSWQDDEGGIVDAGSARLINGTTGAQIGNTITGDTTDDRLGFNGITALANNNFVIASSLDDESGVLNSGSVRLVDGTTGAQIGNTLAGDTADDQLGLNRITALANNNFIIASSGDDENGIVNAGSVILVNGATGAQIGSTLTGIITNWV